MDPNSMLAVNPFVSLNPNCSPQMSLFFFFFCNFGFETSVCLLGLIRVDLIYNDVFLFGLYVGQGQMSSLCTSLFSF